jgi:glycosyltransferase involved in cell wall biosynthesis
VSKPLTVLQVGAFPFPAGFGSQVYVQGMSRALARRGHRVILACYASGSGSVPPELAVMRNPRVPGVAFTASGPHWSRVPSDALLVRTVDRALRWPVDVIHAHNVEAPVVAWLARRRRKTPLVYNLHTRMSEELPAWWPRVPLAGRLLGAALDAGIPRLADATIAISAASAAHLAKLGVRHAHLPPGIDPADLAGADPDGARARWDLGDRPWVVYAGNTDPYQDLPVLIRAVARLPDAGLLLISGGDLSRMHREADAAGLPTGRRRFISSASFADHRDALAAGTVGALPRTQCAGFPIKLLNQLGLGLVTVAAAGSAQPIAGVLAVPNHDDRVMADAIGALIRDPERRMRLSDEARAAILGEWTWDARAGDLEEFYRDLLAAG